MSSICRFSGLSVAFDGQALFTNLGGTLPGGVSALVGPNGRGKSVLLRLLAGALRPTTGSVHWERRPYRIDQLARTAGPRVADALGVAQLHDAFSRISLGRGSPADLDRVADLWHLPAEWQQGLEEAGLTVPLDTPVSTLSGGQQTRLALCAAFLHRKRFLLLDEPSNHLDRTGRDWFMARLFAHPGGALVASHDRALLRRVGALFELGERGLRLYGGGYDLYRTLRDTEAAALERQAEATKRELRRTNEELQAAQRRAARRRRQGERLRHTGSQSPLLLDAKADRAGRTESRQKAMHEQRSRQLQEQLAQMQTESPRQQRLAIARAGLRGGLRLHLEALALPWVEHPPLNLTVRSGERWRLEGANGAGKSTLLKVISGQLAPRAGACRRYGSCQYLDQECSLLAPQQSALDNLHRLHPAIEPTVWRTRLGAARLRGDKVLLPVAELSGGERLKVALLAVTGGPAAADLLLLDEPDNHLDLDSRALLEASLRDYPGTLIVVSHDEEFVEAIGVTQRLLL